MNEFAPIIPVTQRQMDDYPRDMGLLIRAEIEARTDEMLGLPPRKDGLWSILTQKWARRARKQRRRHKMRRLRTQHLRLRK